VNLFFAIWFTVSAAISFAGAVGFGIVCVLAAKEGNRRFSRMGAVTSALFAVVSAIMIFLAKVAAGAR
jgi:hypothetical protein